MPWPSWFLRSPGRKDKSVPPSTSAKAVFTPPTTKDVEVQAQPPQPRTFRNSSFCGTLLVLHALLKKIHGEQLYTQLLLLLRNIPPDPTRDHFPLWAVWTCISAALKTIPFRGSRKIEPGRGRDPSCAIARMMPADRAITMGHDVDKIRNMVAFIFSRPGY